MAGQIRRPNLPRPANNPESAKAGNHNVHFKPGYFRDFQFHNLAVTILLKLPPVRRESMARRVTGNLGVDGELHPLSAPCTPPTDWLVPFRHLAGFIFYRSK